MSRDKYILWFEPKIDEDKKTEIKAVYKELGYEVAIIDQCRQPNVIILNTEGVA